MIAKNLTRSLPHLSNGESEHLVRLINLYDPETSFGRFGAILQRELPSIQESSYKKEIVKGLAQIAEEGYPDDDIGYSYPRILFFLGGLALKTEPNEKVFRENVRTYIIATLKLLWGVNGPQKDPTVGQSAKTALLKEINQRKQRNECR